MPCVVAALAIAGEVGVLPGPRSHSVIDPEPIMDPAVQLFGWADGRVKLGPGRRFVKFVLPPWKFSIWKLLVQPCDGVFLAKLSLWFVMCDQLQCSHAHGD